VNFGSTVNFHWHDSFSSAIAFRISYAEITVTMSRIEDMLSYQ
jgi:hypothetical protein